MSFRAIFLVIVVLFSAKQALSAEKKTLVPPTAFNGQTWNRLKNIDADEESTRMFKVCLLRGIYEGAYAMDPQNALQQYGPWISFGTLVEAMDRFYAVDRNQKIPITQALVLIARDPSGPLPTPVTAPGASTDFKPLVSMEQG